MHLFVNQKNDQILLNHSSILPISSYKSKPTRFYFYKRMLKNCRIKPNLWCNHRSERVLRFFFSSNDGSFLAKFFLIKAIQTKLTCDRMEPDLQCNCISEHVLRIFAIECLIFVKSCNQGAFFAKLTRHHRNYNPVHTSSSFKPKTQISSASIQ